MTRNALCLQRKEELEKAFAICESIRHIIVKNLLRSRQRWVYAMMDDFAPPDIVKEGIDEYQLHHLACVWELLNKIEDVLFQWMGSSRCTTPHSRYV